MQELGACGLRPAKGRLTLLVGPPITHCPVAVGGQDPEVLSWADGLSMPWRRGDWTGLAPHQMPPRLRTVVAMQDRWLKEWDAAQRAERDNAG